MAFHHHTPAQRAKIKARRAPTRKGTHTGLRKAPVVVNKKFRGGSY